MPTVDNDVLTVRYPDMFTLIDHLKGANRSLLACRLNDQASEVSYGLFKGVVSVVQQWERTMPFSIGPAVCEQLQSSSPVFESVLPGLVMYLWLRPLRTRLISLASYV
jgi:hypothetical protein